MRVALVRAGLRETGLVSSVIAGIAHLAERMGLKGDTLTVSTACASLNRRHRDSIQRIPGARRT